MSMSMKSIFEEAIRKLEAERDLKASEIKDSVTKERIIPFNAEIDRARDKAIAEAQAELQNSIGALNEQFSAKRAQIIEMGEKKKAENSSAVITTATYSVTVEYDKAISKLREQVENFKN